MNNNENKNYEHTLSEREEQIQNFVSVINRIATRLALENNELDTFDWVGIDDKISKRRETIIRN